MEKIHQEQPMTLSGSAFRNAEVCPTLLIMRVSLRIKDTITAEKTPHLKTKGIVMLPATFQKKHF